MMAGGQPENICSCTRPAGVCCVSVRPAIHPVTLWRYVNDKEEKKKKKDFKMGNYSVSILISTKKCLEPKKYCARF